MPGSWQRLKATLDGQIPDRVPLVHVWGDHRPYVQRTIAERGYTGSDNAKLVQYRRDEGFCIGLRVTFHSSLPRGSEEVDGGAKRYTQGALKPGVDLEPFEHLGDLDALLAQGEGMRELCTEHGLGLSGYITNCVHAVATAMGWEAFALTAYDDPAWLGEALEQAERHARRGLEVMFDLGVDMVCFDGDCAYRSGLLLSPPMMRDLWFERTLRTRDLCRDAGVYTLFHSDGKADDLLPMLIEMGFDAFHGCEKQANDLADLKRRFGQRITLFGNADHTELTHHDPGWIVAETRAMLAAGAPGGRYVADVNTAVPDCKIERYAAFHETCRDGGRYAPTGELAL